MNPNFFLVKVFFDLILIPFLVKSAWKIKFSKLLDILNNGTVPVNHMNLKIC